MSHHNNQEFPGVLLDEMDRILVQIRQINDQAEALISRARDIAALAKRTVSENTKVHLESMKAEERIRQADQVIEREAQREVERREQAIDEGRVIIRGGSFAADAALRTEERAAIIQDIAELSGQRDVELAPGITTSAATPPDVVDDYYRGFGGMLDRAEEHDANGGNLISSGEDLAVGGDRPLVMKTLEEAAVEFVRGTIAAQAQIEESLPGQAEGMNTGAAEELSPQPAEAAPVNAAEEAKVIPPEDSSAVIAPASERLGRVPQPAGDEAPALNPPIIDTTEWSLRQQDLGRLATTARQNANAREANEFSDKVLDMWNSTLLTEAQIAKRLATGKSLISQIVEQARVDQDPRVMGKRGVVAKMPKEHMPLSAMARKIMERPAPIAATRAGVELGKFDPPAKGGEKSSLISTGVCVVDIDNRKIYGKRGIWTADRKIVETVVKLNGGQMFGKAYLTTACGWRDERELTDSITPMIERLRDIGIVMTSLPTGIVIRVAD